MFLDHNAEFNNTETSQMPYTHRDLSHIGSEITYGRKLNERVTVNGAGFFVGWRLTPYPTYRSVVLLSAMRAGKLPDGGALRLIRATPLRRYVARLSVAQAGETAAS